MGSSVHIDNKNKDIFILGPTQRLDDTTLPAEAKYPINFTQSEKRFLLSLHYNWSNISLLAYATKNMPIQSTRFRSKTTCTMFR